MSKILMSIKPEFVEKILNGEKKYEYRKTLPKKNIDKIIIYSTYPIKKIVGEVEVKNVLIDNIDVIWSKTKNYSGTNKEFFLSYYKNKNKAIAYELGEIKLYNPPLLLSDFNINFSPQSFIYLD